MKPDLDALKALCAKPTQPGPYVVRNQPTASGEKNYAVLDDNGCWVGDTAGDLKAARVGYVGKPPSDEKLIAEWRDAMDYRATHDCRTYEAGCPCRDDDGRSCWRPSIFMPRWASRISLEVVGVRVERVQDISADDAIAEGIDPTSHRCGCEVCSMQSALCTATQSSLVLAYADLWRSINGAESWDANPFVWVISFKRIEAQECAA